MQTGDFFEQLDEQIKMGMAAATLVYKLLDSDREMLRAYALATAASVQELQAAGFSREEAIKLASEVIKQTKVS